MLFLKKHYEKIILMSLLLVFIVAMVYLIVIFSQKGVSLKDLEIERAEADYDRRDFNKVEFQAIEAMDEATPWRPIKARDSQNEVTKVYTDLLQPFKVFRSPHSQKLVAAYYEGRNDPWPPHKFIKKGPVKKPPPPPGDTDKGGIPDLIERQFGLNPKDPVDDRADSDQDGFDNYVEWQAETNLTDSKSHPSYINMLRLVAVERKKLPVRITRIVYRGDDDKRQWEIHVETKEEAGGRMKTRFLHIGEAVKIEGENLRIIDVKKNIVSRVDPTINAPVDIDHSDVILQPIDTDIQIVARVKAAVFEPNLRILVKDLFTGEEYKLNLGKTFIIGEIKTGRESVVLVSLNRKDEQVVVQDRDGGKWIVTKKDAFKDGEKPLPFLTPEKTQGLDTMPGNMPPGL